MILGMHRGGTSALCGALNLVGVDFGKHLLPADDANERGYWEHEEIVRAHDGLLLSLGSWWDDVEPLPADWAEREITRQIRSDLIEILKRDFADSSLFGIKDPRLCRLMPLWLPIFQTLEVEPHFVFVVRHPWEVAESLARRDGIKHAKSYLLWLEHLVQAERATRSLKRWFICYEELLDDPAAILVELGEQLGLHLSVPCGVQAALRQFLDATLRHHQFHKTADRLRQPVSPLAAHFYQTIRTASTPTEITRKLGPLAARFALEPRAIFITRSIRTQKLSPENVSKISLDVAAAPREVRVSTPFWLDAKITNEMDETLSSTAPYPINLAYHWMEKATRRIVVFDGNRSRLSPRLDPNSAAHYRMKILPPDQPGEYILQTTIVQEGVFWLEDIRPGIAQEFVVSVLAHTDHPAVSPDSPAMSLSAGSPRSG